jgi:acetyl esterase/lipase
MLSRTAVFLAAATLAFGVQGAVSAYVPAQAARQALSYGSDPLQTMDFYPPVTANGPAPLIVFVHGGGWKRGDKGNATGDTKVTHFTGLGYALASVDYRLVPQSRVEDQAQDVADSIAYLVKNADRLGIDPSRIVVMGHSAGAHLAALIGTDPSYLRKAGLSPEKLSGVVLLDGAAYDVPAQMRDGNRFMQPTYAQAFGADPARQRALSPTLHAAAPNAPAFLILHVDRDDGTRQSEALAKALQANGVRVEQHGLEGKGLRGHMQINRSLGDPGYAGTGMVDSWLAGTARVR